MGMIVLTFSLAMTLLPSIYHSIMNWIMKNSADEKDPIISYIASRYSKECVRLPQIGCYDHDKRKVVITVSFLDSPCQSLYYFEQDVRS